MVSDKAQSYVGVEKVLFVLLIVRLVFVEKSVFEKTFQKKIIIMTEKKSNNKLKSLMSLCKKNVRRESLIRSREMKYCGGQQSALHSAHLIW